MKFQQIRRDSQDFQQPVDEADLKLQLGRELPGETIRDVTELQAGLFNNTYRVDTANNAYILKVAPRKEADVLFHEQNLMRRERTISSQLESVSPLVPAYMSFFTVCERDASLQRFVHGKLWHDVIATLTESENDRLWEQLGDFARELHNCRGKQYGYPAPSQSFDRWSSFIFHNVEGLVADCRRLSVMHDEVESYCRLLPRFAKALDAVGEPRLLHGDLWPRNVIIEGAGSDIQLKAVFDGERAFWGDPASDWVLILYGVPGAFWRGYGENLLKTRDPACIAIYKGMYFIVNILESVRFNDPDTEPRKWLCVINRELKKYT